MNHPNIPAFSLRVAMLCLVLLPPGIGNGAEPKAGTAPQSADRAVLPAHLLIPKEKLEQLIGWELRDAKLKDMPPGLHQCDFTTVPKAYTKRRFDNPPLPEAAGFSSVVITTFPTTPDTFAQSRRTMGTEGGDIPGIGDGAFLNGPAMIYVRSGNNGFSIRLHVETPKTDAGRTRLREVLLSLAREGMLKLNRAIQAKG